MRALVFSKCAATARPAACTASGATAASITATPHTFKASHERRKLCADGKPRTRSSAPMRTLRFFVVQKLCSSAASSDLAWATRSMVSYSAQSSVGHVS